MFFFSERVILIVKSLDNLFFLSFGNRYLTNIYISAEPKVYMALDRAVLYFIISIHSDDTAGFNRLPNHSFCPGPVNRDGLCNVPVFSILLARIQMFYPPLSHNTAWLFCVLVGD